MQREQVLKRDGQFSLGHIEFEGLVGHFSGDGERTVEYFGVELQ